MVETSWSKEAGAYRCVLISLSFPSPLFIFRYMYKSCFDQIKHVMKRYLVFITPTFFSMYKWFTTFFTRMNRLISSEFDILLLSPHSSFAVKTIFSDHLPERTLSKWLVYGRPVFSAKIQIHINAQTTWDLLTGFSANTPKRLFATICQNEL